jgi:hypothetical protein
MKLTPPRRARSREQMMQAMFLSDALKAKYHKAASTPVTPEDARSCFSGVALALICLPASFTYASYCALFIKQPSSSTRPVPGCLRISGFFVLCFFSGFRYPNSSL